ncbi:unnamed protein product [Adineta ricciae]|uniref:Tyrosine-protein kinase n=1 Tax=Adineta ricciae TaxID=249248 RepID=A0A813S8C9_ADIRI|nr:unnamed protein product [Adineta ricciae]
MSHRRSEKFENSFSNHDGCRILSLIINDEYKILQETKKLAEKRITLDEQYAKSLQELAASADRLAASTNPHPLVSISRDVFLQWSHLAALITSQAEQIRETSLEGSIKQLMENKVDSRKYLDEEKRRYDAEYRKAKQDIVESEKRYADEIKVYTAKNNELTKLQTNARKSDESRIKSLKDVVLDKRGCVYRAHNDYVHKIREYKLIDEQYTCNIRNLVKYHEESQLILNESWQNLLDNIASYPSYYSNQSKTVELARQTVRSINLQHCYDQICDLHSNTVPLTTTPEIFNQSLLQSSNLSKLKADQFVVDNSTKQDLKQKIDTLTENINQFVSKPINSNRDKLTYFSRKDTFQQEQFARQLQTRRTWEQELLSELKEVTTKFGYNFDDDGSEPDSDDELTDQLKDQPYFHGVIPRNQSVSQLKEKGDYLVRINEQGRIVLSVYWSTSNNATQLKDSHFYIIEQNNMFSLQHNGIAMPSVNELIAYYKRQKLELRDNGIRLIRPIARPDYMVNNDEVSTMEVLGKGHFGEVSRGEYRGQKLAIKTLRSPGTNLTEKDRQNFINEAFLLQQYRHKNIVKFIGIAAMRDPMMILMELIEQGSLDKYLKKQDYRVSQLIQMCYDIAKGMAYLEKCNVIHRDLAARNCLVDKRGRIKVADFGLSRCLQSDEEYFCQVKEIPVRWWAIEVFSNAPYTVKADVWSYGVTAWEVFSKAELPYPNIKFSHAVIDAIKFGERLRQPERCPAKIFSIMEPCWFLHPKDRPSFEKLVELLKKEKRLF